jgi:flagellar hook-length control protein FliK
MQTDLPVAPQTPAAAQLTQPAQPQSAAAAVAPPAVPQFGEVMAKALAGAPQVEWPAASTEQPIVPAASAEMLAVGLAQALPLPDPSGGTDQIARPAAKGPRKGEATDRRSPLQAGPEPTVYLAAMPAMQAVPPVIPSADLSTRSMPMPTVGSSIAATESATAATGSATAVEKRTGSASPPDTALKSIEPNSAAPDGPAPAGQDVLGAASTVPPVQASSQVATELATSPLQTITEPAAARTPASVSPRPALASPAAQVAPVLVSMANAPDGAQRLTLRLDPPELGHVEIRIDRPASAPAHVDITVQRPETLILLLRDQPQLQRALDQAGVPPDGRSVTFHVATAEAAQRPDGAPAFGTGAGAGSGSGSHSTSQQGGSPSRHAFADTDDTETDFARVAPPGWVRAGLDITA